MSWIGNKANQMSLRTGVPICNHGNLPVYHPVGGRCGCDSIFQPRQYYAQPQPPLSGLMRAGFITNLVFGCLDYGMNWIGQILGWCGIGGGGAAAAPQQTQPEEDSTLKALKDTFSDSRYTVSKDGDKYVVIDSADKKTYRGKTLDEVLEAAGFSNGTRRPEGTHSDRVAEDGNGDGNGDGDGDGDAGATRRATSSNGDGAGDAGARDKYGIDHDAETTTKVNTIKFGGPYHYAQLYTYEDGTPIPKGSADFKALVQALKTGDNGIQESGNQRVLHNQISLPSGKTVKLVADPNVRIAQGFTDAKGGGENLRYQVYQETNGRYYIYKNGNKSDRIETTFQTQQAAEEYARTHNLELETQE